ncbi:hypothetical protein ZTR_08931 [Talaromyces verruculosus]|nr:hypothetical protein ZTR_08931 [Talaromyces verruculosus]
MSKSILITGCSTGGIGASLALALSQKKENHHVFATARNTSKIPKELHNLPNVTIFPLDVSSSSSVAEAVKIVRGSGHGLDVLINNAGLPFSMPLLDANLEDAQRVYEVNLWGVVRMIQGFADMIIERKGSIVNVGSIGGMVHLPWNSIYASSKAALTNLSETLRHELSPFGVSVICLQVGGVDTNFDARTTEFNLPPNSYYATIKDDIAGWATGSIKPRGQSGESFAEAVVSDILGARKKGVVFRGKYASSVRVLVDWFPGWVVDMVIRMQNPSLNKLATSRNLS